MACFSIKTGNRKNLVADISYDEDLQSIVDRFTSLYAKTDETHDEATCPVAKDELLNRRGIEVGHYFFTLVQNILKKMGATVSGTQWRNDNSSYGLIRHRRLASGWRCH